MELPRSSKIGRQACNYAIRGLSQRDRVLGANRKPHALVSVLLQAIAHELATHRLLERLESIRLRFDTVVNQQAPERLRIEGIAEAWLKPTDSPSGSLVYRPAVLIEFTVNFRSLRAGLNHSEERIYSAWLPEADLALDWDSRGGEIDRGSQLTNQPDPAIGYRPGNYLTTRTDFEQCVGELIERLVRTERLRVYFNPVFGLFSTPGDQLEEFLARVADSALGRIEPELKRLRSRFELQLEQVREAQAAKGLLTESLNLESFISNKLHFFESENRLAGMFSTLAGTVFGSAEPRSKEDTYRADEAELREDLERIEQEASEALRALYDEYLALANEYDTFDIGVQPNNLQVIRSILLWVPVEKRETLKRET